MKKLIQTLILLSFLPGAAIGQNIFLSGTVMQNDEPVANTNVYAVVTPAPSVNDTVGIAVTNSAGLYEMNLPADENDSLLVWLSTDACPDTANVFDLAGPQTMINLSCGGENMSEQVLIGASPISDDQLTWYFMTNATSNVDHYEWYVGGTAYDTPDVTHTFSEPGTSVVTLAVYRLDGYVDSAGVYLNVGTTVTGGSGNCQSLFFPLPDSSADGSVYFVNSSLGNNLTYLWDFGDGSTSTEAYPTHTFADDEATYTVCLTIISGNICEQEYCVEVSGGLDGSGLIVNGIKPVDNLEKSGSFDFVVIPVYSGLTGVNEANAPIDMTLYPNPSTGIVTVQLDLPASEKGVLNITDITGKIVAQKPVSGTGSLNTITVNMDKLADGAYLLQYNGNSISKVQKVILQR